MYSHSIGSAAAKQGDGVRRRPAIPCFYSFPEATIAAIIDS
jgi:hypothetical protein